jgi:hypothetical protein
MTPHVSMPQTTKEEQAYQDHLEWNGVRAVAAGVTAFLATQFGLPYAVLWRPFGSR